MLALLESSIPPLVYGLIVLVIMVGALLAVINIGKGRPHS